MAPFFWKSGGRGGTTVDAPAGGLAGGCAAAPEGARSEGELEAYVVRQPVFDRALHVVAYRLLFRAGAVRSLVAPSQPGIGALTRGRTAHVHLRADERRVPRLDLLPRDTVVEIHDAPADAAALADCQALIARGARLSLRGYDGDPRWEPLLPLVTLVKIDFGRRRGEALRAIADRLRDRGLTLGAEGLMRRVDHLEAIGLGCSLFEGAFYTDPEHVRHDEVPILKINQLRLLDELYRPGLDFERIEFVLKRDVALSVKLLRHLNSAAFGHRQRVTSIRQALVMLGETPFKVWASAVALAAIGADKAPELLAACLVRARLCELAGRRSPVGRELDLFLLGMLSLLDALFGRPLAEILAELPIAPEVETALAGADGPLGDVLRLARAFEAGRWDEVATIEGRIGLHAPGAAAIYREAVAWTDQIVGV